MTRGDKYNSDVEPMLMCLRNNNKKIRAAADSYMSNDFACEKEWMCLLTSKHTEFKVDATQKIKIETTYILPEYDVRGKKF